MADDIKAYNKRKASLEAEADAASKEYGSGLNKSAYKRGVVQGKKKTKPGVIKTNAKEALTGETTRKRMEKYGL